MVRKSVDDILRKYEGVISRQVDHRGKVGDVSQEYEIFKEDMMPRLSSYERWAKSFAFFNLTLSNKDNDKIQKYLDDAHLDLTPGQVATASFMGAFFVFFIGILSFLGLYFFQNGITGPSMILLFLSLITSFFIFYYIYSSPQRLANQWRLRASSQMVPCILYIVVYMKHTSNLERAIEFASKHLRPPLSLDLKKIFWNVETGKFSTIKESLDDYLKKWEKDALEFVEAFHLIESSLYEPSESRRVATLEKSLQVILDGVYEKMLVYSREIRSPLTNLYMLGIVLPTLGLALLPLASTLLGGMIKFYHVFIMFNLIIPFFVFYLTNNIMMRRPGGYGESDILELNPYYDQYVSKGPYLTAFVLTFPLLLIGLLPFILQIGFLGDLMNLPVNAAGFVDFSFGDLGLGVLGDLEFFDFKKHPTTQNTVGPFGLGSLLLSLLIPLSIAMFFSIAYKAKTKELIKYRDDTKILEREFTNSLFQLGNRLGDGTPAEVAFANVANSTRGQKTESFFRRVNLNLHQAGMSLERAIFDPRRGAIIYFPSQLVATSMRILLESVKKGLKIAAESLMSISEYLKNIQKVQQRLNDLLAEVVSDMRSNMTFLAPLLSGIVVGLSGMITLILNRLSFIFQQIQVTGGSAEAGFGNLNTITDLFSIYDMIPPYYLQLSIGIYIIQIIFILTMVLVTIDSGDDKLKRTNAIGKNLGRGMTIYFIITLLSSIILSVLAAVSLQGLG